MCEKRQVNWTAITEYINSIEWIYKERKARFYLLEMLKSGLELLQ